MHKGPIDMPKVKLDTKDREILRELEISSRQSASQIAKKVGLSKEVVNYRIKKLIKENVIEFFATPYNYTKMGYFQSMLLIKFHNYNEELEKKIISFLKGVDHIFWVGHVGIDYDIDIIFQTRSMSQLERSFYAIISNFNKKIAKRHFSILTERYSLRHNCIYGDERKLDMVDVAKFYDEVEMPPKIDLEIMKLLKRDSRMAAADIAKRIGATPATVSERIKKMVKSQWIKGFFIRINLPLIGYSLYNVLFRFKGMDSETEKKMISYFCGRGDVGFVSKMMGGWDMALELQVKDEYELHRILNDISSKYSRYIYNYTYLFTIKKYPLYTCEF